MREHVYKGKDDADIVRHYFRKSMEFFKKSMEFFKKSMEFFRKSMEFFKKSMEFFKKSMEYSGGWLAGRLVDGGAQRKEDALLELVSLFGREQLAVVQMHQDVVGFQVG